MSGNGSGSLNTARSPFPGSRARVAVLSVLAVALLVAVGFVIRESSLPAGGHRGPAVRQRQTIETRYESGDRDLDGLQQLFRPALEANHKQISGRLGVVRGFGAGDAYPQIWVRDSATILQLSRWLYPREELTSWVEELLAAQKPDGGIVDWIAAGAPERFVEWAPRAHAVFEVGSTTLTADTNTTEADQESSMVQAVHLVYQATSDDRWLKKRIMGTPIIERTEAALSSLARRRRDARTGLISSAFTADWGDVSPLYPDQRAIYLDDRTPVVVGLYTNAGPLLNCAQCPYEEKR